MNNLVTFSLALILGVVAAGMNWFWIESQSSPDEYVAIKKGIEAGDTITEKNLVAIPVPGSNDRLRKSLIPFSNRAILFGLDATRDYEAGDVVLQRDIQAPDNANEWEYIGPFRLISVGERFSRDDQYASRSNDHNVTIAVDANFDEKTRKLLNVISPDRTASSSDNTKIAAVQVAPSRGTQPKTRNTGNIVYQTVSLQGVAHVPRVLLEGDMIRFVVRGKPVY
ncbi:MAG: hypothetical protein AAF497_10810 [Planctomycetota bacterium]